MVRRAADGGRHRGAGARRQPADRRGRAPLTLVSYVLVYTPLKLRTSLSTIVGAIPGALPAVIGWTAATNTLSIEGWVLFAIVFMWQMPHFLAIAWMCRDDYARAGIPLLPVIQPDGRTTGHQAVLYTAALIPVSLLPTAVGLAERVLPGRRDRAGGGADGAQPGVRQHAQHAGGAAAVLRHDPLPAAAVDRAAGGSLHHIAVIDYTHPSRRQRVAERVSTVLLRVGWVFIRRREIASPSRLHAGAPSRRRRCS